MTTTTTTTGNAAVHDECQSRQARKDFKQTTAAAVAKKTRGAKEQCNDVANDVDLSDLLTAAAAVEVETFDEIWEYTRLCSEYGIAIVDAYDGDLNNFEDCYMGVYNSEEDFAREIVNDCYDLDKMMGDLSYYFDYAAFARDLFTTDYKFDAATGAVFRR